MKTIAHISDLHFGREDPPLVEGLLRALQLAKPDILIVSGDLTQRAKKKQFRAAREFLDSLPEVPQLIVPGNHDVSATNLYERLARPLQRYERLISDDLSPFLEDPEVAIAGLNTVRLLSTKDGRLNRVQVETASKRLQGAAPSALRVVVTHHPLAIPVGDSKHPAVQRARMAMALFANAGVDLFLSGHLHSGLTLESGVRHNLPGYNAVVAHAGTAISTRTRNEPNGWNLIRLDATTIEVQQMQWAGKRFLPALLERYAKTEGVWASRHSE